jgi:hypothetical protein
MKWRHNRCGQEVMKKKQQGSQNTLPQSKEHDNHNDDEKERQLSENSRIIPEIKYLTVKEVQNEIACLNPRKPLALKE